MKILLVNAYYFKNWGVESYLFRLARALKKHGHSLMFFCMKHPQNLPSEYEQYFISYQPSAKTLNIIKKFKAAGRIIYSVEARKRIRELLKAERPDIVHIQNIEEFISPSIIPEIKRSGIPMVMTLHNYKMVCPLNSLFINGRICQACSHKRFYQAIAKKCIAHSVSRSIVMALEMYLHHCFLHTYQHVDTCIAPSKFLVNKLKEMGCALSLTYVPHCIDIDDYEPAYGFTEKTIVYAGRLVEGKGLVCLLDAIKGLDVKLQLCGTGSFEAVLRKKAEQENITNVEFLGFCVPEQLKEIMRRCIASVYPSVYYESFGYGIVESYCYGKPVIGSRLSSFQELIEDEKTGFLCTPGSVADLREKIMRLAQNPELSSTLGRNARSKAEQEFSSQLHYERIFKVYQDVLTQQK